VAFFTCPEDTAHWRPDGTALRVRVQPVWHLGLQPIRFAVFEQCDAGAEKARTTVRHFGGKIAGKLETL
jgi:hypothetical protein